MVRRVVAVREPAAQEAPLAKRNRRRAGSILLLVGVLLIALAAGDALAVTGAVPDGGGDSRPRGPAGDALVRAAAVADPVDRVREPSAKMPTPTRPPIDGAAHSGSLASHSHADCEYP